MSVEQTFSQADLRKSAQDYKRASTQKHKWALGASEGIGRAPGKPRPYRPSETNYNLKRREDKSAVASLAHGAKIARKHDMLEGAANTDDSSASNSDEYDEGTPSPPADAGVAYSFDAPRGPTKGSQILNTALAKAMEKYEERETVNLVKAEYELLDGEGETVAPSPDKKRKAKPKAGEPAVLVPDADEDYEFV